MPVSCFKMTFKVRGPYGVGSLHGRIRPARVSRAAAAFTMGNEAVSLEDGCDSALGRPGPAGEPVSEELEQLFGAVGGVLLASFDDGVHKEVRRFVRAVQGAPGAILEADSPLIIVPGGPFVPGLAADTVPGAEFGKRKDSSEIISNE